MTSLLRKILVSVMNGTYESHETYKPHSLHSLRNYFVREISGSFVVAKAASPEELATTTTTGAGGLEGNEAGGRESRRGIR
jgi:hypothetical protein